ncbi:CoA-disulfide reductase [Paenibacillus guangzhouensis]|uniref:CoA-disulfide reductase n=1 Tax=Paenibacillus guangzhouensis TaxID=1473112 RepID=UPI00126692A2|nr:CoA-disulfide reductase [Paenibacillus guangzhouensis]
MGKKIVIVGGVAGGASAAARLRRLSEQDEIIMFERGEHISFANCGLPYYIGDVIKDRKKLLVQTVEGMSKKFNLDVRNYSEVTAIHRERKAVSVRHVMTGETYEEAYDLLILSPGAKPIRPQIPGIEEAGASLFTLRNIPDTDRIKSYVDQEQPKHAVVIGGGFIGVEMAENLRERGLEVALIEMQNQVMAPLDVEMAAIVQQHMTSHGIDLILEDGVASFGAQGKTIQLTSGRRIHTDMIILAIGVAPENQLARDAGLDLGVRGAIQVNESMQTSDSSIYAIGDAVEVQDYIHGFKTMVPLAWGANRQGRLVADHINGKKAAYAGALGTAIVKVFDLTAAVTGSNEKTLRKLGIDYEVVHVHPSSHAGYYPGASPISLKLVFNKETGQIYGAQAVGADGVDKRIDVIATAIKGGLTVLDLPDLELSYAPPFSSAKDPVNMAGYVASNIVDGLVETVQWHEIDEIIAQGGLVIDVREPIEREAGYIPGTINIPLGALRDRMQDIPVDQTVYVSCQVGLRGYLAARILSEHGRQVKNVDGGYKTYSVIRRERAEMEKRKQQGETLVAEAEPTVAAARETTEQTAEQPRTIQVTVDACGLQCPGPILQVYQTMSKMKDGEVAEVSATDPGFSSDIASWCEKTGNTLLESTFENKVCRVLIQKGTAAKTETVAQQSGPSKNGATLVVFSGDLDKTIASFIIATGAAAMGKPVTMFFTFWGLNVLRKSGPSDVAVDKDMMEKMFGMMMPKGPKALPLSKMNMGGMGAKMIQYAMGRKNVDSLETLMKNAIDVGVKLVACTMSMDIMGIKAEELIDGVEYGGVATYLGDAEDAGLNLFI